MKKTDVYQPKHLKDDCLTGDEQRNLVSEQPSIARSTALMAVATMTSRATGLVRTAAMAFALGNALVTSSYQVANNLPTIIFELVAGGLLAAAFVPLYIKQMQEKGKEAGDKFASNLLNIVVIVLGGLSVLATIFAPQLIATQTFTLGDGAAVNYYAIIFFRIFAIQMLFYGLGGIFTSILNANRVFFITALAPLFNNLLVIASLFAYWLIEPGNPELAIIVLAVGTTLGVAAQFAIQIPAILRLGFKYTPRIDVRDPVFLETIKTGIPMLIYVIGTMVSFTFRNAFALSTGDDGPSTLIYAWTWFQLPHGILAASLSRALFTEMSSSFAQGNLLDFKRLLKNGLSGTLFIVIPLAGLMFALAAPLMQMFHSGAFTSDDVAYVGVTLQMWVFALPFYSLQQFFFSVYSSIRRFTLFSIICTALCVLQCALYVVLTQDGLFGLSGIPVADIVYYALATTVLLFVLQRIMGQIGTTAVIGSALRVLLATVVGSLFAAAAYIFLPIGDGMLAGFVATVLYGSLALLLIFALCRLMRVPELALVEDVWAKLRRRFSR
ncbi:MAG: murein biosynthesis integral membrane protein MurJ [Coriobacteriales bacterium]|nr:murein biosynthesis integral membrane protein MurJ [Coriobacteriales bacterium]